MAERPINSADEVVLMFNTLRNGDVHVSDSTTLGKVYSLDMLLDDPGDTCPCILILNTKTLKSTDVTEQFAQAWLRRKDSEASGLDLEDEDYMPEFVRNSRAWAVWKADLERERPYNDPDRLHDERRDHAAMGWV